MAIRVREVDGQLVALCAAKTEARENDVYLDDGVHYALMLKFARDYDEIDWNDEANDELARSQYVVEETGA